MAVNVLLTRKFFDADIQYIKNNVKEGCNLIIPDAFTEDVLVESAKDADILLGPVISKAVCAAAPHLKFIQVPWAGVDALNFDLIREIGVKVCNSHSNAYAVAEHAIALMLDSAKKIAYHDRNMRDGEWNRPKPDKSNVISPFSKRVSGSTVGIIGYGHIGRLIKQYLSAFGCKFIVADAFFTESRQEDGISFFTMNEINTVLNNSDYLFLCVPLTATTREFFGMSEFAEMKNSAILINTSRGEIVHEGSLYEALYNNMIAGAAFDTWWNNPKNPFEKAVPSLSYPFEKLGNLILSPHRAAMVEGELPHLDDAILNINRTIDVLEPLNEVSVDKKF